MRIFDQILLTGRDNKIYCVKIREKQLNFDGKQFYQKPTRSILVKTIIYETKMCPKMLRNVVDISFSPQTFLFWNSHWWSFFCCFSQIEKLFSSHDSTFFRRWTIGPKIANWDITPFFQHSVYFQPKSGDWLVENQKLFSENFLHSFFTPAKKETFFLFLWKIDFQSDNFG